MTANDLKFLALALLLACLPLPQFVVVALLGLLLVAQVAAFFVALLAHPPQRSHLQLVSTLNEAVALMAIVVAKSCWLQGNPFPLPALGWPGLLGAVGLNGLYLHWMLHHSMAHRTMQRNYADGLADQLAQVETDLEIGIRDEHNAERRIQQLLGDREMLDSICTLGQQAGGMALLQLACLAVATTCDPSAALWVGWTAGISLPGLINSKAQDLLLNHYLPRESRLC